MPDFFTKLRPGDLPSPSQSALRVIEACADRQMSAHRLKALVATDPVLTAELLRIVNSAYFGTVHKVRSVAHAIAIIGQRALRNLALCLSVRDTLRGDRIPGFDAAGYTDDCLRRASAARLLGERAGHNGEECFTAGLLQDFGLLAMFHVKPELAGDWPGLRALAPDARRQAEQELFGTSHDAVIGLLQAAWRLPEELSAAILSHHQTSATRPSLAGVMDGADWLAAMFSGGDKAAIWLRCQEKIHSLLKTDAGPVEDWLDKLTQAAAEASRGLGMRISEPPDKAIILNQVNLRLAEENISYQELTWKLQQTLEERDRLAREVQQDLNLAREIQQSLLPADNPSLPFVRGRNLAAKDVSGDFFDYLLLGDGRLLFTVADVSGKGMNAALIMAKTGSLFRGLGRGLRDLERLMAALNRELLETSIRGMFVTMVGGILEPTSGRLSLVNAGHPDALLLAPDGSHRAVAATAPPLGIVPGARFPTVNLDLDGDCLYLYTDGVTEHLGGRCGVPDTERLLRVLRAHAGLPLQGRLAAILDVLHPPQDDLADDITLLALEGGRMARGNRPRSRSQA